MKKILLVFVNLVLYFVSVLFVGFVVDKLWGIDMPLWEFALFLTIGWGLWKCISFALKRLISKRGTRGNL